jgi:hypothetical protein
MVSIDSVKPTAATASRRGGDEEDVDDREDRLEHELEHHRDGEQQDGAPERTFRILTVVRPGDGLANRRPQPRRSRRGSEFDLAHSLPLGFCVL